MSYLNPLRLHFAGRFQAAPSTVNNDMTHFNIKTFKPEYQQRPGGWWNPRGDADWRLIGCEVTAAWLANGSPAAADDMVLKCLVADSDRQVAAKLVDLDPEQQLVSAIWGLEVRICDENGETLLRGEYETASFMDIWDRAQGGSGGDITAGAMYQSVLSNLEWGNVEQSPFLTALCETAQDGLLSIKFNVDGYNMSFSSPDFTMGRIVGTIGPATASEPRHFTVGRHFMAVGSPSGNFFAPVGKINFCPAVVDPQRGKITLDLGNALPTTNPGGALVDLGALSLAYATGRPGATQWLPIDTIPYAEAAAGEQVWVNTKSGIYHRKGSTTFTKKTKEGAYMTEAQARAAGHRPSKVGNLGAAARGTDRGWYETTAGVTELPANRSLTAQELEAIATNPLALLLPGPNGDPAPAIQEASNGAYVTADNFVLYLSPGDRVEVDLYTSFFGQPLTEAQIELALDPGQLQGQPASGWPDPGAPTTALDFPATVPAGPDGVVSLPIQASDPGNPRVYIDGQVYGIRPAIQGALPPGAYSPVNPWNFISLLVWDAFAPDEPPTWWGSLQPIFQQYANLYPVMDLFVDLGDYESVCDNLSVMRLVFGPDRENPNSMPVTRDLSPAKRAAILRWLEETGPDGKPLEGTQPTLRVGAIPEFAAVAEESVEAREVARKGYQLGGKAAAASRRLVLRSSDVRS
ncbi:MAG: hypothetical protein WCD37_06200 [Chloroflexia bacterium]